MVERPRRFYRVQVPAFLISYSLPKINCAEGRKAALPRSGCQAGPPDPEMTKWLKLLGRTGSRGGGGALLLVTASATIGLGQGRGEGDQSNEETGNGETKG